jgi:hypothetical protein
VTGDTPRRRLAHRHNVWFRSDDPDAGGRLEAIPVRVERSGFESLPHAGRRWVYSHTTVELSSLGARTWLVYTDSGVVSPAADS